jgi:hypothetical protein
MPTRRDFLTAAAMLPASLALTPAVRARTQHGEYARLRVDGAALRQNLEELSGFGRPSGGIFTDGVTRLGYSPADVDGRTFVMAKMRAAGLTPRIDAGGNIFARRAGQDLSRPPLLFGSHIDSVVSGGNFDGDLGSLAALEARDRGGGHVPPSPSGASTTTRAPLRTRACRQRSSRPRTRSATPARACQAEPAMTRRWQRGYARWG